MDNQIQDFKSRIGQAAEGIIAAGLGLKRRGTKYHCTNTTEHRNGDRNPSMSWDKEVLQFYCFTCSQKIDIYGYYRDYLNYTHDEIVGQLKDKPQKPKFELQDITPECVEYLKQRKINEETIKHFKLRSYKNNIAFPYYKDSIITGVKYRKPAKHTDGPKYLSVTGSEFGLFNRQNVKGDGELIICEGEIDAMTIHQAGFTNVVSVGTGANALDKLFKQEKDFLNSFQALIIVSDNDEAGEKMDATFFQEFGTRVKLIDKSLFTYKDVNLEFYYNGTEKIEKIINSARVKIEGLRDLDVNPYKGMEAVQGRYIPTGIRTIDNAINDLAPGCVTLITGRSNEGKSTFINQIIVNAIDKGNSVFLVNGEGLQEIIINNLYKAVIGRSPEHYEYRKINRRFFKEPKPEVLEALKKWHKNKLLIFSRGDSELKTTEQLFDLISSQVKANRFDLIVLDNLMSLLSVEKTGEKLEKQADFMQRCCNLAKLENIHIILAVHPNKTYTKGSNLEFEQISGTQDLANKADNIVSVRRAREEEGISGEIAVLKNRYFPELPKVKTHHEPETGLLLEIDEVRGDILAYSFGWRKYLNNPQTDELEGFDEVHEPAPW